MKIDYTRYYLKWHSDTEDHQKEVTQFYERILSAHLPDKSAAIIEISCGMGLAMTALSSMGCKNVCCIECDEHQVHFCKKRELNVALSNDTTACLSQRCGSFDLATCMDVIENIPVDCQLGFASAIANSLRSGGKLICSVPNANSALAPRWRYNDWTHTSSFTEHSLDFLLFNAGLNDIHVTSYEFLSKPFYCWLPISGSRHWWAFRFFRFVRHLRMMAVLDPDQAGEKSPFLSISSESPGAITYD